MRTYRGLPTLLLSLFGNRCCCSRSPPLGTLSSRALSHRYRLMQSFDKFCDVVLLDATSSQRLGYSLRRLEAVGVHVNVHTPSGWQYDAWTRRRVHRPRDTTGGSSPVRLSAFRLVVDHHTQIKR